MQDVAMTAAPADPVIESSLAALSTLWEEYHPRDFEVALWDGSVWPAETSPRFRLALRHPGALRRMFWPPTELATGEAYIFGDYDIEGDVEAAFAAAEHLSARLRHPGFVARAALRILALPSAEGTVMRDRAAQLAGGEHTRERDGEAIRYHYDVGNDFYRTFLDQKMVYSCGYFDDDASCGLDEAQRRKLDLICRKLRLKQGDVMLDIGCGWGGLALHAANLYGASVLGVTLSEQQARAANDRFDEAGVATRCRAEVCDYRDIEGEDRFDKIVSVGMFEHVGRAMLPAYFAKAHRLLREGGVFLNHGITANDGSSSGGRDEFIQRYVFPDGELVPISDTLAIAEGAGFEVRDVESLREHYAQTLRHWVRRLEDHAEEARRAADDVTYRIWRLYMAASAHNFAVNNIGVYQALLVKPSAAGHSGLPLTREDWYPG